MLKNHLSFIEPRNYSTENMDHIMDGKCAVSDSQALSFYSVEPLYEALYEVLLIGFVSKMLCSIETIEKIHIMLYIKVQVGRKTRLQLLPDCVSVRRTIMDVRDS